MADIVGYDPENTSHASPQLEVGGLYECQYNGVRAVFRYVQNSATQAITNGQLVNLASTGTSSFIVTSDTATDLGYFPVGVGVGTIAASEYGFVLVDGFHPAVLALAGCAVGKIYPQATDGSVDDADTATTGVCVGYCTVAIAGGVIGAWISIP